jgi:hypothetical protein
MLNMDTSLLGVAGFVTVVCSLLFGALASGPTVDLQTARENELRKEFFNSIGFDMPIEYMSDFEVMDELKNAYPSEYYVYRAALAEIHEQAIEEHQFPIGDIAIGLGLLASGIGMIVASAVLAETKQQHI